jgi:hypothetical protein
MVPGKSSYQVQVARGIEVGSSSGQLNSLPDREQSCRGSGKRVELGLPQNADLETTMRLNIDTKERSCGTSRLQELAIRVLEREQR